MNLIRLFNFLLIFTLVGCKTKYATKEFKYSEAPKIPNYSELNSWAAHPEKNDTISINFIIPKRKI